MSFQQPPLAAAGAAVSPYPNIALESAIAVNNIEAIRAAIARYPGGILPALDERGRITGIEFPSPPVDERGRITGIEFPSPPVDARGRVLGIEPGSEYSVGSLCGVLTYVLEKDKKEIAKILLVAGAHFGSVLREEIKTKNGTTKMVSAYLEQVEAFTVLKNAEPEPEKPLGELVHVRRRDGQFALHVAVGQNIEERFIDEGPVFHTINRLLEAGAKVNARDKDGGTALINAAECGHIHAVRALLAKGADPSLASKNGINALIAAVIHEHTEIVRELLQHFNRDQLQARTRVNGELDHYSGRNALEIANLNNLSAIRELLNRALEFPPGHRLNIERPRPVVREIGRPLGGHDRIRAPLAAGIPPEVAARVALAQLQLGGVGAPRAVGVQRARAESQSTIVSEVYEDQGEYEDLEERPGDLDAPNAPPARRRRIEATRITASGSEEVAISFATAASAASAPAAGGAGRPASRHEEDDTAADPSAGND